MFFNLHDENQDGKVRFQELKDSYNLGPIHVFDVSGQFSGKLFAYVKVGFDTPLGYKTILDKEYELAEIKLLDFAIPRPTNTPPALATVTAGVMTLAATPNRDEIFVSAGPGAGEITVDSLGRVQTFSGVTSIVFDGGTGTTTLRSLTL